MLTSFGGAERLIRQRVGLASLPGHSLTLGFSFSRQQAVSGVLRARLQHGGVMVEVGCGWKIERVGCDDWSCSHVEKMTVQPQWLRCDLTSIFLIGPASVASSISFAASRPDHIDVCVRAEADAKAIWMIVPVSQSWSIELCRWTNSQEGLGATHEEVGFIFIFLAKAESHIPSRKGAVPIGVSGVSVLLILNQLPVVTGYEAAGSKRITQTCFSRSRRSIWLRWPWRCSPWCWPCCCRARP